MPSSRPHPSRFVDLSHTIEHGMVTYKGLPAPLICDFLSREASRQFYAPGTEFHIGKIEMVANTGTYLDAPFHRFADGLDVSQLAFSSFANLDAVVIHTKLIHIKEGPAIEESSLSGLDIRGKAVLFHTGWDRHWRTDAYFEGHPFLTQATAERLVASGVTLAGIDSHNIDDIGDLRRPVHTALLGAGIPIVEHLCNLSSMPMRGARFFAVPVKVKGFGTVPVRAFGLVED